MEIRLHEHAYNSLVHSTWTIQSIHIGPKKYYKNPHAVSVTSHWQFDLRKIHVLLFDCDVRSIIPHIFRILLRSTGKNKVLASYGENIKLFNFLNITFFFRRNGVISADGQILSMSALLQSVPTISVINNYTETWNLDYYCAMFLPIIGPWRQLPASLSNQENGKWKLQHFVNG